MFNLLCLPLSSQWYVDSQEQQDYSHSDLVPVVIQGVEIGTLSVDALLP